ncbi:MAG: hypothetical protein ACYTDX_00030 [Planctomycetota bacterium]
MRILNSNSAGALTILLATALTAASPSTAHFDPVISEMNARELALDEDPDAASHEKALLKGFKLLAKDSKGLKGDLKLANKLEKALRRGWKTDAELDDLFDELADDLVDEVAGAGEALDLIAEGLAEGKARDKVRSRMEKGDNFMAASAEEEVRARSLKFAAKALKQYEKGEKIALKSSPAPPSGTSFVTATVQGQPWASNNDFGPGVGGQVGVSLASGGIRRLTLRGRRILPSEDPPPPGSPPGAQLPGAENLLEISITGVTADIAPGTYFVGNNDGVSLSAAYTITDEDDNATTFIATSGSVTITEITALLGSGSAAGSFGFTVNDFEGETQIAIASGMFEAFALQRSTVE